MDVANKGAAEVSLKQWLPYACSHRSSQRSNKIYANNGRLVDEYFMIEDRHQLASSRDLFQSHQWTSDSHPSAKSSLCLFRVNTPAREPEERSLSVAQLGRRSTWAAARLPGRLAGWLASKRRGRRWWRAAKGAQMSQMGARARLADGQFELRA